MARSREVDAWFARLDHPLKPEMLKVREALLDGDPRLGECIKWQCPTFTYGGDLASINPIAKQHVSLLFHTGAEIPGYHHHHLEGEAHAHFMKFMDGEDVEAKRPALAALARVWCDWRDRAAPKAKAPLTARTKAKPGGQAANQATKKTTKKATKKIATKAAAKRKVKKK